MTDADDVMRTPPQDYPNEQAVLGSALVSQQAAELVLSRMVAAEFYTPAHGVIFEAIHAVARAGQPVDPHTVHAYLAERGLLMVVGGAPYLHTLMSSVTVTSNVGYHIEIVRERAIRRKLIMAGQRILQRAYGTGGDDIGALAEECVQEVQAVRDFELGDEVATPNIAEFLADDGPEYDWLIPDLLERGDRLILTGSPGLGKSTLFRQLAVKMAAGLHPFKHERITPLRVMLIDCENPRRHVQRKFRPLVTQARLEGFPVEATNLWLEVWPDGMDLMAEADVSRLLRRTVIINPDVIMLGPLYKLCPRAMNTDDEAAPVLAALNQLRRHGAAVLLEAHAGHGGSLRPRGSAAFMGWPEFGYGLREVTGKGRTADFVGWRGDRDERKWPERIQAGGVWPWSSVETWTPHDVLDEEEAG